MCCRGQRWCAGAILVLLGACLGQQKAPMRNRPAAPDVVLNGDCYQGAVPDVPPAADGGVEDGGAGDAASSAGLRGSLDKEDIRRVVKAHTHQVKRCYEERLLRDPSLAGREVFRWTIGPTGAVLVSHLKSSQINDPELDTCIGRHICDWKFPPPSGGGKVIVAYPFVLQPISPPPPQLPELPVDPTAFKGYRSPHMLVHSDADRGAVEEVVQRLEEIYAAITTTILAARDDFPIELILLASDWDFRKLSSARLGGIFVYVRNRGVMMMPYKEGGYEWGPAGLRNDYLVVAVHEMAHRLIDDALPHAPPWFHEGLASFLETAFIREGSVWYGVPGSQILQALAQGPILPLHKVLTYGAIKHSITDRHYYATAWLLINYLMVGNAGQEVHRYGKLWRRLQDAPKPEDWPGVLIDVFDGKPLASIEAELQKYADVMIVARRHALRLKQVPIEPMDPVPLRQRESDPEFVEQACRVLQAGYADR